MNGKWTLSLTVSALVGLFATTSYAQDAAEPTTEPAAPAPASAEPAPAPAGSSAVVSTDDADAGGKLVIGLRLGYGIAMGSATDGGEMTDAISGQIPIWLDLGYMVTPNIMVGLYGQYGFGVLSSDYSDGCDADDYDCSIHDIRVGVQGQYHFSPSQKLDPWVGLGIGYEWMTISQSGSLGGVSYDGSGTLKGFEFANLQGGFDYKLSPALGIGPFVSMSFGRYDSVSTSGDFDGGGDIDDKAMHEWFTFGVRGAFSL